MMSNDDIAALRKEIEALRAEVADVSAAIKSESSNTTQHINAIYRYIGDMHDYVMPILHKVFPNYAEAKKEVDTFIEGLNNWRRPK